ncbi:MAG: lipoyl(octanoyl) transferase LipB [Alphaproteobacteria bacterium]|nr:MAG: lipoyl(octanoyl) transferase LipB [Alphaproteobacteria bacterium]
MDTGQGHEEWRAAGVVWRRSRGLVAYEKALRAMEDRVAAIRAGSAKEMVWLLEHPPLYTAGTSARPEEEVRGPLPFPLHVAGRGGKITYHGPGQRVAYVMIDLRRRGIDVRAFVRGLEAWVIAALAAFGIRAVRRAGRVGIWVPRSDGRDDKIAAIGIRVRQGISFHGIAVNVKPDLSHYAPIIPCGIREHGITSLAALGVDADIGDLDRALEHSFGHVLAGQDV